MSKKPISVTLDTENLAWLRARTRVMRGRSVSDTLDSVIRDARATYRKSSVRSVVGTIEIDASDPLLTEADRDLRAMFDASLSASEAALAGPKMTARRARKKSRG